MGILVLALEHFGARVQPSGTLFANSYNFFAQNSAAYFAIFKKQIKSCISDCKKKTKKAPEPFLLVFMNQEDSRSFFTEHGPLSLTVPIHLTSVHIHPVRGDTADSVKLGPDCRTRGLKLLDCEED